MRATVALLPGLDGTGDLFAPLLETARAHLKPVVFTRRSFACAGPAGGGGRQTIAIFASGYFALEAALDA